MDFFTISLIVGVVFTVGVAIHQHQQSQIALLALSKLNLELQEVKKILEDSDRNKMMEVQERNFDLLKANNVLSVKQKEYKQFFALILDTIMEDTTWLRASLFQRIGEVPELTNLNSQIIAFETKINQIKLTLKEYKMMENYDE